MMTAMTRGRNEGELRAAATAGASLRRGACPTLAAPLQTGDGLLVRLRPASGFFTPGGFLALLDAADAFGNGRLDLTARGNLQIRGLTVDTMAQLAAALDVAGIVATEGVAVETPPLAGIDPAEIDDPRPLAARLSRLMAESGLQFAPKLSIVVDGGGRLHLGDVAADLRLHAEADRGNDTWHLSVAGRGHARFVTSGSAEAVVKAAMTLLGRIAARGRDARARDLGDGEICLSPDARVSIGPFQSRRAVPVPVGTLVFGQQVVLGLAPAFGQMEARRTRQLIVAAMESGLSDIRLAPGRALLLLGMPASPIPALGTLAQRLGFVTDAEDPAIRIDACAGAGACASGAILTQATARLLLVKAPALMDGSIDVHVSGCPKGCARPRAAGLTLVGAPGRHGLVIDGLASDMPVVTCRSPEAHLSIAALGRLVADAKQSGESAASCLKRLGPARIAASFQRD